MMNFLRRLFIKKQYLVEYNHMGLIDVRTKVTKNELEKLKKDKNVFNLVVLNKWD